MERIPYFRQYVGKLEESYELLGKAKAVLLTARTFKH